MARRPAPEPSLFDGDPSVAAAEADAVASDPHRTRSVFQSDADALVAIVAVHAPTPDPRILDVTHNTGKMWQVTGLRPVACDRDARLADGGHVDVLANCKELPFPDESFDVVVFDPPHLPNAAANSTTGFPDIYGLRERDDDRAGENISAMFPPFLAEAARVLRPDGIVVAKLADFVHNHRYQWSHIDFVVAVRAEPGLVPCDHAVVAHPASGNLESSLWERVLHLRRAHSHMVVVRKGRCEPAGGGQREATAPQ